MSSYSLDVENFIGEVRKYPELWNVNCEEYKYKHKKQRAWDEIGRIFISDFDDIPELEKFDVYRKLHSKWRNIRDAYVRYLRRPVAGKAYMYCKQLKFLDDVYRPNQQSDSDNHVSSQSEDDKPLKRNTRKKRKVIKDTSAWISDEDVKRKKEDEIQNVEYVETQFGEPFYAGAGGPLEDDDKSFFDSLLPAVRGFDMDQKLEFRSQIITLIKNIRSNKHS